MKTCSKCGETKPLDAFSKDSQKKSGLSPQCKICRSSHDKSYRPKYRAKNKEALAAKSKEWWAKNYAEKMPVYSRRYYEKNADKLRSKALNEYRSDPSKHSAKSRAYYASHSDERKEYHANAVSILADFYVASLISRASGVPTDSIPPELIEAKRTHLQLVRTLKQEKQKCKTK